MIRKSSTYLKRQNMENNRPDYKKIFEDIITKNCPERKEEFNHYFLKKRLSIMDIITLNSKIFKLNDKDTLAFNQKHKSYDEPTILKMLNYQKQQGLNNVELANHFNLSRNTVTKWRKLYSAI